MIFKKIILFFFVLLFQISLDGCLVTDALKTIPADEYRDIADFFYDIFFQQDGCYTIFGDKPVSSASIFLIPQWKTTLKGYPSKFYQSWKKWLKHKGKFPIKNYAIVSERYPSKKNNSIAFYIYVINKKKFIEVMNQNRILFESILREPINPENFLADIESEKKHCLIV